MLIMRLNQFLSLASLALLSPLAAGQNTLWLCGDSTMAPGGGNNGTEGWGQYLQYSFDPKVMAIKNAAFAGRSARTFTREGRFQRVIDQVKAGDWVLIQFGHNDDGVPANDLVKLRVDCPGMGNETCPVTYNNQTEIVQTYVTYLQNATRTFLSLGARVIISPPTPQNPYEFGNFSWSPTKYSSYASYTVQSLGGPANGVYLVDHAGYDIQSLKLMGKEKTGTGYPMDHTHLAPWLADSFAKSWALGVKCGTAGLQSAVVNATSRIEGPVLGTCLSVDDDVPI